MKYNFINTIEIIKLKYVTNRELLYKVLRGGIFLDKIKNFIIDVIKYMVKYMIILIIAIGILILGVYMCVKYNDLHPKGWNEFEKNIQKEYGSIKNVEVYDNERCIFLKYSLEKDVHFIRVKEVFKDTRDFLLTDDVFSSIEKYHNDFHEIYIRFYNKKGNGNFLYEFHCIRNGDSDEQYENFKMWDIRTPDQENQIFID